MTDNHLTRDILRHAPLLPGEDTVAAAVRALQGSDLPALPVVDAAERLAGIFGEREFLAAIFPGYLKDLHYAGFVPSSLDAAIEKQARCRDEPVIKHANREHIDVGTDFSDIQVAEIFLHHRVLVIPVVDAGKVLGVITRGDFFRRIAERFLDVR